MILLLAVMMTPVQAALLGMVFSIAGAISPLLVLTTLAVFFPKKCSGRSRN
jgi:hypothetical protein